MLVKVGIGARDLGADLGGGKRRVVREQNKRCAEGAKQVGCAQACGTILRVRSAKFRNRTWSVSVLRAMLLGWWLVGACASSRSKLNYTALKATGRWRPIRQASSLISLALRMGLHKVPDIFRGTQTIVQWHQVMKGTAFLVVGMCRAWRPLVARTRRQSSMAPYTSHG